MLVSVIAPFTSTRNQARTILGKDYIEIFVKASLETIIKRDTKGLYKKAISGKINNLIGYHKDTPYEKPISPDIIIDTDKATLKKSTKTIIDYLLEL